MAKSPLGKLQPAARRLQALAEGISLSDYVKLAR
jgi:hypothetical protein